MIIVIKARFKLKQNGYANNPLRITSDYNVIHAKCRKVTNHDRSKYGTSPYDLKNRKEPGYGNLTFDATF